MAKTIHTILYDDTLDGSKIVTMDNCVCQLYDIKRNYDSIIRNGKVNLSKPALYVLLNRSGRKAYIGETDDFSQRLASHMLKKDIINNLSSTNVQQKHLRTPFLCTIRNYTNRSNHQIDFSSSRKLANEWYGEYLLSSECTLVHCLGHSSSLRASAPS